MQTPLLMNHLSNSTNETKSLLNFTSKIGKTANILKFKCKCLGVVFEVCIYINHGVTMANDMLN